MKKTLTTLFWIIPVLLTIAQTPQAFKYQAVVRDVVGDLLADQNVSFRISIHNDTPGGTIVYQETHTTFTNEFGIANLEIGRGDFVSGVFEDINWGIGDKYLEIELDPNAGSVYTSMGTTQLLSVPYALYSKHSEMATDNDWTISGNNMSSAVTGNVGIGTSSPQFLFSLDNGGILATGVINSGDSLTTSGAGTRMIWYPRRSAFRAGTVNSNEWDNYNIGKYSAAFGNSTQAITDNTFAAGHETTAYGINSAAFGYRTNADAYRSTVFGYYNIGGGNPIFFESTDPLFEIGNGDILNNSNALTILKNGNVGLSTHTPSFKLCLEGDGGIISSGTITNEEDYPTFFNTWDDGPMMLWYPKKYAFRAGYLEDNEWDDGNIGRGSAAFGEEVTASGNYSFATGFFSKALGSSSVSLGGTALGHGSLSSGLYTVSKGDYSTALGFQTESKSFISTAIGSNNIGGGDSANWIPTDPLFEIGNGQLFGDKSNAMTVLKNGKIGIGTHTPEFKFSLETDGGIIAKGDFFSGDTLTTNGTGTRLIWYPREAAFRAGHVYSDEWDNKNIGSASVAFGKGTIAKGSCSLASGSNATANEWCTVSLGSGTSANGSSSTAIGASTIANGALSTSLGGFTKANGYASTAMGFYTIADSYNSIAIGVQNIGGGDPLSWIDTDPLLEVGNGIYPNKNNALTILKNGNIGINTHTPSNTLHIEGSLRMVDGNEAVGNVMVSDENGVGVWSPATSISDGDWSVTGDDLYSTPTGRVGIGTSSPEFKLSVEDDGGILAKGTFQSGESLLTSGEGTRLIWYPKKAAFRAGRSFSDEWDNSNIGDYSIALGSGTQASGNYSTALGSSTSATGDKATSLGWLNNATGAVSTALGGNTTASGEISTAIGGATLASGDFSTATGYSTIASGEYSTAMSVETNAEAYASTAIGRYNLGGGDPESWLDTDPLFEIGNGTYDWQRHNALTVLKNGKIGIGTTTIDCKLTIENDGGILAKGTFGSGETLVTTGTGSRMIWYPKKAAFRAGHAVTTEWDDSNIGNYSIAMGYNTEASYSYSVALGSSSTATADYATAIGASNQAMGISSTAIGGYNVASGVVSTALGAGNSSSGEYATSFGFYNTATGNLSTAFGAYTDADASHTTAFGTYNVGGGNPTSWVETDPLFEIGNGTSGSPSNALTVLKNGKTGIGTATPSELLTVDNGTTTGTYTTSGWLHTSDASKKTDIQQIDNALDKLTELNGIYFQWINSEQTNRQVGLIAQDVEKVVPEVVVQNSKGIYSMSYDGLIPLLIEAIKEQQEEIESLRLKIENLEK